MGAISFFIFFFTLLVLARQVSHPAQPHQGPPMSGPHICNLIFLISRVESHWKLLSESSCFLSFSSTPCPSFLPHPYLGKPML